MSFADLLEHSLAMTRECIDSESSRLAFLGEHIFDFTTYDDAASELFAGKALEVCGAISDATTFDYIKDAENYRWFLLMVNMPFFAKRLEWGTSIRGAWWDHANQTLESSGLFCGGEQVLSMQFTRDEWIAFIRAMGTFARG